MRHKRVIWVLFSCFLCRYAAGQENPVQAPEQNGVEENAVSVSAVFHNIGWNALHSVTYNYGLNFIGAGLGTWGFIETGADWKWRNIAYNNTRLAGAGIPPVYIGYLVPPLAPVALYISGRFVKDEKLQLTGLALAQSLVLTLGIQSALKMTTGRASPGIITGLDHVQNPGTDDFSRKFNWFNMQFIIGWPSGHTANAFSAAATVAEIYHDNLALQIGAYTYAALMGLGVSVSVHWASEVFAGALIGCAIGKTVGRSFRALLEHTEKDKPVAFYMTPHTVGVTLRL
jgi:membrane-associated phospholipid phosphatase